MATIEIMGVPHSYELTAPGASPHVLVFIHGWLLSREYWQPLVQRLTGDYQCLAYDLRGFGQSQLGALANSDLSGNGQQQSPMLVKSCYNPSAYAADLAILLRQLNISSAWLIGHSLGGTIALWGAEALSDRVKGVICVNAGGGIYLKEAFEKFRSAGQQLVKIRPRWLQHLPLVDLLFTRANVARPLARSWGRQRLIDFVVANPEAALGTLLDSTDEDEINRLPKVVSQLKQPVYFITGAKDKIMEPKYVRHLASFHSLFQACGDNVIEIPHCGHLAMVEQPDTVANLIRTILAQHNN